MPWKVLPVHTGALLYNILCAQCFRVPSASICKRQSVILPIDFFKAEAVAIGETQRLQAWETGR
jgi:hypothetical protein